MCTTDAGIPQPHRRAMSSGPVSLAIFAWAQREKISVRLVSIARAIACNRSGVQRHSTAQKIPLN